MDQQVIPMLGAQQGGVLSAHVPQVITKELKIATSNGKRKARLSNNWLPIMQFEAGKHHTVSVIGQHKGIELRLDDVIGTQKVYRRKYNQRKNNPFETQIEISNQSILDQAIPSYTERLHFEIRAGRILITPVKNKTFMIRKATREMSDPRLAFVALTSGIDCRAFEDAGWSIDAALEYRPQEKRDNTDKTETGALNILFNSHPRVLFNENIYDVNMDMIRKYTGKAPQIGCLSLSVQCDEFGNLKAKKLKDAHLEDLETSADMAYPALRLVEEVQPATVLLENVPGFFTSEQYLSLIKPTLRRWGYDVQEKIFDARHYGGKTLRKRGYMVASVFPGFEFPKETTPEGRTTPILDEIQSFLADCRDVTHCKSVHDGIKVGRDRHINSSSLYCPTIFKSQSRQPKDAIYIAMDDGRFLFPTNELLAHLQGFPNDMNLSWPTQEVQTEIIGQSIEYPMHEAIIRQISDHLIAQKANPTILSAHKAA